MIDNIVHFYTHDLPTKSFRNSVDLSCLCRLLYTFFSNKDWNFRTTIQNLDNE